MKFLSRLFEDAMVTPAPAGNGSLIDLGEPPVVGVNTRTAPKKKVKVRSVTEAEEIDTEDNVSLEDEDEDIGKTVDPEDTVSLEDDPQEEAPPPVYGDKGMSDAGAEEILDKEDVEEEEEEEPPKLSMSRMLQYKQFKPRTNRHARKEKVDHSNDGINVSNGLTSKMFGEALGSRSGLHRETNSIYRSGKGSVVVGAVTSKDGRYILTSIITTGDSNREFVFEGDRVEMIAMLTLLRASMKDISSAPKDIVDEVDTRVTPVDVLLNQDSLLTHGVQYAKQIVAQ